MSHEAITNGDSEEFEEIRDELESVKGYDTSELDIDVDDHDLSGMDSERRAPIEYVAENVVNRYDKKKAFLREYLANGMTACVQAARHMIREDGIEGDVNMQNVRNVLDYASDELGYDPIVEVQFNRDPTADYTLRIKDNGIGIPKEKAPAIRDIGLSGWNDDGTTNGQFGQGTMSGFLPCSPYGEFHMLTNARTSDDNYRVAWKLTDVDQLPGERYGYGTTFEWPTFTDEALTEIDVKSAVKEYSEGMIVPVVYEEYDTSGRETGESDEFLPMKIEDRYPDHAVTVVHEDQFGRIVWSPSDPEGYGSTAKTWCGFQPINRNDGTYGTSNRTFDLPSKFDIRVKVENGAITEVREPQSEWTMDHELVGQVPISDQKYDSLADDRLDGFVRRSEVPDGLDVIRAPEPTDDRDRFESAHVEDYMERYAEKCKQELINRVSETIESLDSFEEIADLDSSERELMLRAVDEYVEVYKKNDEDRLAEDVEETFGVSVSEEFAGKLGQTTTSLLLVPRGTSRPGRKRNAKQEEVWEIVEEAGSDGDVYIGQNISQWKADIVWEMHDDNQVVRVDTRSYDKWQDIFGWKLIKNLPSRRNLRKKMGDQIPDDVLDEHAKDPTRKSVIESDENQLRLDDMGFDEERAKHRRVKIRTGTGATNFREMSGEDVFEKIDQETFQYKHNEMDWLILYDRTDGHSASAGEHIASVEKGVAYAAVPKYVYEYLIRAESAVTEEQYVEECKTQTVRFYWSDSLIRQSDEIQNMDERDVFVLMSDSWVETYEEEGLFDELAEAIAESLTGIDSIDSMTFEMPTVEHQEVMDKNESLIEMDSKPSVVSVDLTSYDVVTTGIDGKELYFDCVLPDLDRDAPEWSYFSPGVGDDETIDVLSEIEDAGGFVSTDDDTSVPENPDCTRYSTPDEADMWYTKTIERLESYRSDDN